MILLDITTSYQFRHWRPMGILRVEREVLRTFRDSLGPELVCVLYDAGSHAFYRLPEALLQSLILAPPADPPPPSRALTARSRLRSRLRIARFLLRARARSRAVPGEGPLVHLAREEVIGEELLRLSLEEYALLRGYLTRLGVVVPRYRRRAVQFDGINHKAHHGLFSAAQDRICIPANRIDPAQVTAWITAGGFWGDDRARLAWQMRVEHGWTLHYLLYDLVPILWRHVAEPGTRETFPPALHWALWGADQIWTISETTRRDLLEHAGRNGYPDPPPPRAIPLGCELPGAGLEPAQERAFLAERDLASGRFVLMVGTQEPRKNHEFSWRLWRELHRRHPGQVLPLVWAGQPGWAIGPLLEQVAGDYGLPYGAIRILSDVDDAALTTLYRHCRFTLYPSHYEGWGLPVVESLNFGKPCLTSDAPALSEAGRGLNEAIGLFEGERWLQRCHALMTDEAALAEALARVRAFEGWSWASFRAALARDFADFLARRGAEGGSASAPTARPPLPASPAFAREGAG